MLIPLLTALVVVTADTAAPISLIGSSLVEAQRNELFTFFNLTEEGRQTDSAGRAYIRFKPRGDFRALVTLRMVIEVDGTIDRLDLELARSFLNDPRTRRFARDIAKTFLVVAPPAIDAVQLAPLAWAIWDNPREDRFDYAVAMVRFGRRTGTAYSVFTGARPRFFEVFTAVAMAFDNTIVNDTPTLIMAMARKRVAP
jgi:hypothetical protein